MEFCGQHHHYLIPKEEEYISDHDLIMLLIHSQLPQG